MQIATVHRGIAQGQQGAGIGQCLTMGVDLQVLRRLHPALVAVQRSALNVQIARRGNDLAVVVVQRSLPGVDGNALRPDLAGLVAQGCADQLEVIVGGKRALIILQSAGLNLDGCRAADGARCVIQTCALNGG